jgi:hypothetical protein
MLSVIMLNVIYAECLKYALYAECHYAECRYTECRYADCRSALMQHSVSVNFYYLFVLFFPD